MKNKKVATILAGTAITASMLTSCGVYGSQEPNSPDNSEAVTDDSEKPVKEIKEDDSMFPYEPGTEATDVCIYGPPEAFGPGTEE